ncbi:hypothetical protein SBRCBS47491_010018 [Sporothrix bragantina]|uniref:Metallo-beta-lactamase domain-containing protein n=1 Tax=Sporothrix bragantina TaxID=671064 RepID=A0ABP0D242_9PEZI
MATALQRPLGHPLGRRPLSAARQLCSALGESRVSSFSIAAKRHTADPVLTLQRVSARITAADSASRWMTMATTSAYTTQAAATATTEPVATASTPQPIVYNIFEPLTCTWQYIVADPATSEAVIIDPVLNYDPVTQKMSTKSADALIAQVDEKGYEIRYILETHAHADHVTAASYL